VALVFGRNRTDLKFPLNRLKWTDTKSVWNNENLYFKRIEIDKAKEIGLITLYRVFHQW
jgi:hypothetical protein